MAKIAKKEVEEEEGDHSNLTELSSLNIQWYFGSLRSQTDRVVGRGGNLPNRRFYRFIQVAGNGISLC